ncbi:hypothetical protein SUGI_0294990 [Cryptomeria japonica]|nr:hypothetical protein SUGI_0294990 [Cryptomeria japonica]
MGGFRNFYARCFPVFAYDESSGKHKVKKANTVPDRDSEYTYCVYDSEMATGFGVGASLFLFLIMGITRWLCCGKSLRQGGSHALSIVLFIATWLTFLIAEAFFVGGVARNAYHNKYKGFYNSTDSVL